jgi:hypothetical protein
MPSPSALHCLDVFHFTHNVHASSTFSSKPTRMHQALSAVAVLSGAADGAHVPAVDDDAYSSSSDSSSTSLDDEVAERLQQAVELVAEMQLTSEQLKVRCNRRV